MEKITSKLPHWIKLEILILLLVMIVTTIHYLLHRGFTVDDAAISFSFARNFAEGFGLGSLYPGAVRVEGYSNFLWVIFLGAGTRLGFDTILVSKALGLAFSLGCVLMLYLILRDYLHQKWMLVGLVLLPASLTFIFWSVSGLENAFYAFLILSAVYLLIIEQRNPSRFPAGSAIILVLVGMTRPEGLIYALAGLAYKVIQLAIPWTSGEHDQKRLRIKNLLIWIAVFAAGYGIFKAWHLWYFAYPWPNPVYAKAGWRSTDLTQVWFQPEGWVYLRGYFRTYGAVYLVPFIVFGGAVALLNDLRVLVFFALASLILPLYTHDWMVNYRFVYPFIPFATALIILAADQLWHWFLGKKESPVLLRAAALVVGILFAFVLARSTWANIRLAELQLECGYQKPWAEARCIGDKNYWTMAEVGTMYANLNTYAELIGIQDPLYLIPDIGATSYELNYRILDLAGLADIHLARADETSIVKQYLFEEQLPDFIRTHSVWTRRTDLTALSAIWENYIPIEVREDKHGRTHGTFVRKNLIVTDALTGEAHSTELAPGIFLSEVKTPTVSRPGYKIPITMYWYASESQTHAWQQRVELKNQAGITIFERTDPLGYGWYPATDWQTDELVRQYITLPPDIPDGEYILEMSLIYEEENTIDSPTVKYSLNIDEDASKEQALELLQKAENLADQGDYVSALIQLEDARTIYPDSSEMDSLLAQYRRGASLQLLIEAQTYIKSGDIEKTLVTIQAANDLRGRQQALPEWIAFGKALKKAGDAANTQQDPQRSYQLYLAATLADPTAPWSTRGLEQTRRDFLLSTQ